MTPPYFFGYGSLVNRRTHAFSDAHPARLAGWRRAWISTNMRHFAFLSAEPADKDVAIDGLIAHVPDGDWAALDTREFDYERIDASPAVSHPKPDPLQIAVYTVAPDRRVTLPKPPMILLSYLDVVLQGYLEVFGEAGVADFITTTDGWNLPVLNDRADPIYPRNTALTKTETALVDQHLAALDAEILPLSSQP
ncbi:MAG: gamma-glutamylcyclotransferase family protein [Shimia sp.]|uniref:gamma-glutamylcyclotransferase family protein n=1 Tax=Shimia sp. TaxID=1954381 RepID=UPI004058915A